MIDAGGAPAWASDLTAAVVEGDSEGACRMTVAALADGAPPERVLDLGLVPAMAEAGRRFESGSFFLPELLFAAQAMKGALHLVQPLLAARDVAPTGRVVIGTVAGDLHDIGKNIVAAMLEGGGFAVHDLGTDVTPAEFAAAAQEGDADIVSLSALLTTTIPVMRDVVEELTRAGVRQRVKILVGGAPLTRALAAELGADGYAPTASQAVSEANRLLSGALSDSGPDGAVSSARGGQDGLVAPAQAGPEIGDTGGSPGPASGAASVPPGSAPAAPSRRSPAGPADDDTLSSRELVKRTLEFRAPRRLPRQLWVLPWATKRYPAEMDRIERDFPPDITTLPMLCSEPVPGGGNAHAVGTFVDAWGCTFQNLQEGIIGQVKDPQLADWSEADGLRFPRERLDVDREAVAEFCGSTDRYVLAGTCPRPFERLQFLRGTERLYLDLNRPPPQLTDFLERLHAFYMEELTLWAETDVDALTFMDDWGSQTSLLVAPELWRELFKPLYADYVALAHAHGMHAFMHSDGHITEIIPDLIEIGLDALNSQVYCMDVEELGRRFAGQLTFWGEMDRQQLLPRASPSRIAEEAGRLKAAFHRDGGFIAQCEFGPGARPDNVYAYFQALQGDVR